VFSLFIMGIFLVVVLTIFGVTLATHSARLDKIEEDIIQLKVTLEPDREEW